MRFTSIIFAAGLLTCLAVNLNAQGLVPYTHSEFETKYPGDWKATPLANGVQLLAPSRQVIITVAFQSVPGAGTRFRDVNLLRQAVDSLVRSELEAKTTALREYLESRQNNEPVGEERGIYAAYTFYQDPAMLEQGHILVLAVPRVDGFFYIAMMGRALAVQNSRYSAFYKIAEATRFQRDESRLTPRPSLTGEWAAADRYASNILTFHKDGSYQLYGRNQLNSFVLDVRGRYSVKGSVIEFVPENGTQKGRLLTAGFAFKGGALVLDGYAQGKYKRPQEMVQ